MVPFARQAHSKEAVSLQPHCSLVEETHTGHPVSLLHKGSGLWMWAYVGFIAGKRGADTGAAIQYKGTKLYIHRKHSCPFPNSVLGKSTHVANKWV